PLYDAYREAVGGRRRAPLRHVALAIGIVERPRVVAGAERRHDIAALAQHAGVVAAAGGAPDRWMRLLPRPRPDVHLPIMEELAFPVERGVVARHRLDDEIVRLPEPVHDADGILVGARKLVGHALDEA